MGRRSIKDVQRDAADRRWRERQAVAEAPPKPVAVDFERRLRLSIEQIKVQAAAWISAHRCAAFDDPRRPLIKLPDGKEVRFAPGLEDTSWSSGPYLDRSIRCNGCGATWSASNRDREKTP